MATITAEKALNLLFKLQSIETQESQLKLIKEELDEIEFTSFLREQQCLNDADSGPWHYSTHLFYLIQRVSSEFDIDTMADENKKNAICNAIQECSRAALEVCVKRHETNRTTYHATDQSSIEYEKLKGCIRFFNKFFDLKLIAENSLFDDTKIDYLVGVLAIRAMKRSDADAYESQQMLSKVGTQIGIALKFKFLMMMKVFNGLSRDFYVLVHTELIKMIREKDGFVLLCRNVLAKSDENITQKLEIITKIAESALRTTLHRETMTEEILRTLRMSLVCDEKNIICACIFTLKSLFLKADDRIKAVMITEIFGMLDKITTPDSTLCGSNVIEISEFRAFVDVLNALFSSSTVASLPSQMLHGHTVTLFRIYSILPDMPEREKLAHVIQFVLNNSSEDELESFINAFRLQKSGLDKRICFKNNSFQVGEETDALRDDTEAFVSLFKSSNNSLLTFEAFLCLLRLLSKVRNERDSLLTGYEIDEDELADVLHRKFFRKLAIIEPLQEMIQWKLLHSQLNENASKVIDAIREILEKSVDDNDSTVIIFFSLFKELLARVKDDEERETLKTEILKLSMRIKNDDIKAQLRAIFEEEQSTPVADHSKVAYDDAMKLLNSAEIYCKAYGCDALVKLLKKRDEQATINRHTILATALQNMKEDESYAFLNFIRLLTALAYVMDTEVVDALVTEFENEENSIDHRLKLGEAIVKVTEDLGDLSIKFKRQLIHCFLKGARDCKNEFRTSSLSNLGAICKILSYQINSFFFEMFQQLEIIIKSDEYLPSKRAAAMVLSNVLAGMPDLMASQEFLLPIYHLLKEIIATDGDSETRLHAQIGLEHLNEKTKNFLTPQLSMQKEIKIMRPPDALKEIKYK